MRALTKSYRWVVSGATMLALGGCITSQQWRDFGTTELARSVADFFGRVFQLLAQGTT